MAVFRQTAPRLSLPEDFGLGVAVAAMVVGLVVLACSAVASMPTEGPRGEAHQPSGVVYVDIPPAAVPATMATR